LFAGYFQWKEVLTLHKAIFWIRITRFGCLSNELSSVQYHYLLHLLYPVLHIEFGCNLRSEFTSRPEVLPVSNIRTPAKSFAVHSQSAALDRIGSGEMASVLNRALRDGFADPTEAVVFLDLDRLEDGLTLLKQAFPSSTLHAPAVKANPLLEVQTLIASLGFGCEVASRGELGIALKAGFEPHTIIFDSPVKTFTEIKFALELGVSVNANSLGELERIASVRHSVNTSSCVGIRLNPEVGSGTIRSTSVAQQHSKFGVPLSAFQEELAKAFDTHEWLSGLHVHIGSQGMSREQLLQGVGRVYRFYERVKGHRTSLVFNIGGGLPAQYRSTDPPVSFASYAADLEEGFPQLFQGGVRLVTEFGRALHARCGWVATPIEYVVRNGDDHRTLLVHVGADMFLRKAYCPNDWHHDLSICDAAGILRSGVDLPSDVAGPLCFAGDYLGRDVLLPVDTSERDYLLIHDAGAYTFSMWSVYNSRQFPRILGYRSGGSQFSILRERQSEDNIVEFWSAPKDSSFNSSSSFTCKTV
jgi:diaminopimelate decarboxylase